MTVVGGLLLVAACGKPADPNAAGAANAGSTSGADAEAVAEAQGIFKTRCVTCHGPEGKGDGPESAKLTPTPRNYHDVEWQKSVTDEYLEKIIKYGGAAVGKSASMPGNPDLIAKQSVVKALKDIVRGFAGK